jgi:hypothetical protein
MDSVYSEGCRGSCSWARREGLAGRGTAPLPVVAAKESVEDDEGDCCRAWQGQVGVISCIMPSKTSVYLGRVAHSGLQRHYRYKVSQF